MFLSKHYSRSWLQPLSLNKNRLYAVIGWGLLVLFIAQEALDLKWAWLVEQQQSDSYKMVSGIILMGYLGYQWLLASLRGRGYHRQAKQHYTIHKLLGIAAPVFFYLHSTELGYGYLFLLSTVYFGNVIVGLAHRDFFSIRFKHYTHYWMIIHVSLSVMVIILAAYHLYIALFYH